MNNLNVGDKVIFSKNMNECKHNPTVEFDTEIREVVHFDRFDNQYKLSGLINNWFDRNELIKIEPITRDDLKFGDIVTLRNEEEYVIADERTYGEYENYMFDCDLLEETFNKDLTVKNYDEDCDIAKVERAGEVIWVREEPKVKEMTVKEISKALGYDVKIVKERD